MGPKLTDEKKQEMYDTWKGSAQYAAIEKFMAKRGEIDRIELSVLDVCYNL